jgi:hypothetical protein
MHVFHLLLNEAFKTLKLSGLASVVNSFTEACLWRMRNIDQVSMCCPDICADRDAFHKQIQLTFYCNGFIRNCCSSFHMTGAKGFQDSNLRAER